MKTLEELNALCPSSLMGHLSIRFTEAEPGMVKAEMPVDERNVQPFGRLHGGAAIALAESVASAASWAMVENERTLVVGSEVSASHVGAAKPGTMVTAVGRLLHGGRLHHVWEVIVSNESGKTITICRITNTIIPPP